jgi:plastocyanin
MKVSHTCQVGWSLGRRTLLGLTFVAFVLGLSGCGEGASDSSSPVAKKPTPKPFEAASSTKGAANANNTIRTQTSRESTDVTDSATAAVGDFVGVITYDGPAPELPLLVNQGDATAKDADVCAAHDVPDESLLVNTQAGNGLANVFVYLNKAPKGTQSPVPTEPVVMDQKGCTYLPRAMLVRVGQTVLVKSDDAVPHNVHTYPERNSPSNAIVPPNDRGGLELVYNQYERSPVAVKCDVHTWMRAYQLVLDHPFMAVTDGEGKFEIRGLPVGTHKFRIWHERSDFLERGYEIEIKAGKATEIALSFPAEKFGVAGHASAKRATIPSR